jgi:hypothetical protein
MKMRGTIELKIQRTSLKTILELPLKTIEPRLKVPFKLKNNTTIVRISFFKTFSVPPSI